MKLDDLVIFAFTSIHSFFISEVLGNATLATILAMLSFYGYVPNQLFYTLAFQAAIVALTVFLSIKAFPITKSIVQKKCIRSISVGLAALYGLAFTVTTLANELHTVVFTLLNL